MLYPFPQRALLPLVTGALIATSSISAQCGQPYDWAVWDDFTDSTSTGTIVTDGETVSVTMSANYEFNATYNIYGYSNFSGFDGPLPPNTTTPRTTWAAGPNGETTMCFSEPVTNPVLLFASLGANNEPVTLTFSHPYATVFAGNGMQYPNDQTVIGEEGYTILVFPGLHECVTIFSSTPEYYTNITWGLNPHLFEVEVDPVGQTCGSVTFTASGGENYAWSGGNTPNAPTNTFAESGDYLLTVTDAMGCTVVTSVEVQVDAGTPATSTTSVENCGPYIWNGQTYPESGTFTFLTTSTNGCDSIATLVLTIQANTSSTESVTACASHTWNGTTYTTSGTFVHTTTSTAGCDSTATLVLTILPASASVDSVEVCGAWLAPDGGVHTESGIFVVALAAANGCDSLVTVHLTIRGGTSSTETRYTCDPLDIDTLTTLHIDRFGCDSLHHIIPVLYPEELRAEAAFSLSSSHVTLPAGEVFVQDLSENVSEHAWDFGDGSAPISEVSPMHTYTRPGVYTVRLAVTNALGCTDVAELTVHVTRDELVFVPNAFTPDGDGINETFHPVFSQGTELMDLHMSVFDRWGEELCTLNADDRQWDGTFRGLPAQAGAYNWLLRYRLVGSVGAREARGVVFLVR